VFLDGTIQDSLVPLVDLILIRSWLQWMP